MRAPGAAREFASVRAGGRARFLWLAFGVVTLAAVGCDSSPRDQEATAQGSSVTIEDVHVTQEDHRLIFNYRTQTSSTDCQAQGMELPKVWVLVVKPRLQSNVTSVTLFPEDQSLRSVSFTFERSAPGAWASLAPCRITIREGGQGR